MSDSDSCLVAKLGHYIQLADNDRELLAELEKKTKEFNAGEHIRRGGDSFSDIYVVKSGWLYSFTIMPDGRRQVLQVYFPGDIVGMYDVPFEAATHDLESANEACLCPFPKSGLEPIFKTSPSLTALLFSIAMVDQAAQLDLRRTMGRMNARDRVAHFLLATKARLKITNPDMGDEFDFQLTQTDIGDAIGLTNVSVSKALTELEQAGAARWGRRRLHILDEEKLNKFCGFTNRYEKIDVSWFPNADASS